MKRINIEAILKYAIVFICTVIIPNLISNLLNTNSYITVIAGIVSIVTLFILSLVKRIIALEKNKHQPNELYNSSFKEMRLYAISSRYCGDIFSQYNLHVGTCTILIRKHICGLCDEKRYIAEVNDAVAHWKGLLNDGHISRLLIYEYDHIPDNYYALFDDAVLMFGLNNFRETDSTGQLGDRDSRLVFAKESAANQREIKKYIDHFENYVSKYSGSILYDSSTR